MTQDARDPKGRFPPGCPAGPGRPKRQTETVYMAAIGDAVPLDAWRTIVSRAVADAQAGDARARDWVARHVLGSEPPSLVSIAATEERAANGFEEIEDEVTREAARQRFKQQDEEPLGLGQIPLPRRHIAELVSAARDLGLLRGVAQHLLGESVDPPLQ